MVCTITNGGNESLKEVNLFSRVLDEILLEIFLILRDHSVMRSSKESGSYVNWVAVTHVCRRWRNIAINYPPLWSFPDLSKHSFNYIKTFLERAKASPLTIDNRPQCEMITDGRGCRMCEKFLAIALLQLPRIQGLYLVNCIIEDIEAAFDAPAPILDTLWLLIAKTRNSPEVISPRFLSSSTPALRSINLHGCIFNFEMRAMLFKGLTELSITDRFQRTYRYSNYSSLYPDVEELIHIFEACPNLEVFELDIARPSTQTLDIQDRARGRKIVQLPRVYLFKVYEMDVKAAEELFNRTGIPNFCEVTMGIRCTKFSDTPRIYSILHKLCKDQAHNDLRITFRRYITKLHSYASGHPVYGKYQVDLILYHVNDAGHIEEMASPEKVTSAVIELLRGDIWSKLTHLKLHPGPFYKITPSQWSHIFQAVSEVTDLTLEFVYDTREHYLNSLVMNVILAALADNDEALLPGLKSMSIAFASLNTVSRTLKLLEFLRKKNRSGHRLSHLSFDRCNGKEESTDWMSLLSQYVDSDIDWYITLDEWIRRSEVRVPNPNPDLYEMY